MEEIKRLKNWSIIGLSETKIKDSMVMEVDQGHLMFTSGNESDRKNGVAFLVNKKIKDSIVDFKNLCDRLAMLKIRGIKYNINVIHAYMPTSSHSDEEVDAVYDMMRTLINHIPKRNLLILTGDYNCKLGGLQNEYACQIGRFTIGRYNGRGLKLANF